VTKDKNRVTSIYLHILKCPTCHKSVRYDYTNQFRPFCSVECRNQDIINWTTEGYKIPGEPIKQGPSCDEEDENHTDTGDDS